MFYLYWKCNIIKIIYLMEVIKMYIRTIESEFDYQMERIISKFKKLIKWKQ